jgi:hypothetical protein
LALFVARVGANHVNLAMAADQLAVFTNSFHAGTNLHDTPGGFKATAYFAPKGQKFWKLLF